MADTVIILGAGASKQGGAPLMHDFLDVARDLLSADKVGDARKSFETVFRGISALQQVHSKSELDILNLESVFAAFEMGLLLSETFGCNSVLH